MFLIRFPFVPIDVLVKNKLNYLLKDGPSREKKVFLNRISRSKKKFKLSLYLYDLLPLISEDEKYWGLLSELEGVLKSNVPVSEVEAIKQINCLLRCFQFDSALRVYREFDFNSCDYVANFNSYIKYVKESIKFFELENDFPLANNLMRNSEGGRVVFYIPPTIVKLDILNHENKKIYDCVSRTFMCLYSIIQIRCDVYLKVQTSWRYVGESKENIHVSYHTRGAAGSVRIKESVFLGKCTVDELGYSGWHSVSNLTLGDICHRIGGVGLAAIEEFYIRVFDEYRRGGDSKYHQVDFAKDHCVILPRRYVFLPLQVETDPVSDCAYIKTYDLLCEMIIIARKYRINLVIKRHPKCKSDRIYRKLKSIKKLNNVFESSDNIHRLISFSEAVVTVNSGVGLESVMYLKKTITTGKSEYSPVCLEAKNVVELRHYLLDDDIRFSDIDLKKFIYYYFNFCLYSDLDRSRLEGFMFGK